MPSAHLSASITTAQLGAKIEKFHNLDIADMFLSGIPGDNEPLERRAMLLYSPGEHTEDAELITRWLLMHNVQVSNLWYDGAWMQFQQDVLDGKSGIIIVQSPSSRSLYELTIPGTSGIRNLH